MYDMSNDQVTDLIEADLGPGAHGYFTTRGLRARSVPAGSVDVRSLRAAVPIRSTVVVKEATTAGGTWRFMSGTTHNVFIVTAAGSRSSSISSQASTWPG